MLEKKEVLDLMRQGMQSSSLYGMATGREDWGRAMDYMIPDHMHDAMLRYVLFGMAPGGFLSAVVENDLKGAVQRADAKNIENLPGYVRFLVGYAPMNCSGSTERFDWWCKSGGLMGA